MLHKAVQFYKGIRIEKQFYPFPRRQLSLGMLSIDPFAAPALYGESILPAQFLQLLFQRHCRLLNLRRFRCCCSYHHRKRNVNAEESTASCV